MFCDTLSIAVIILKFEQFGSTTDKCIKKNLM